MPNRRILVVGTTPDYISYIDERYSGRALFLTDSSQRACARDKALDVDSEITADLSNRANVLEKLQIHLKTYNQTLSGITCYDCEWLTLTAELAQQHGLLYPSPEAVRTARSKFLTKRRWVEHRVCCPASELLHTGRDALDFYKRYGSIVLKPRTGTGGELTFLCRDAFDVSTAFRAIKLGLAQRNRHPLYNEDVASQFRSQKDHPILGEDYITGREYSADFIVDGDRVSVIRVAKKLHQTGHPFGTTMAYVLPATLPEAISFDYFSLSLRNAAHALGLINALCMADFKINKDKVVFLEMTPRIGGDCLPPLIRQSSGLDTIGLALDYAVGNPTIVPPQSQWKKLVGLQLFAKHGGRFTGIDVKSLENHPHFREVFVKRRPGHKIDLPPDDYDSRILGHVIFEPQSGICLLEQCASMFDKVKVIVESNNDQKFSRIPYASC
jgi:biotin carboxylase